MGWDAYAVVPSTGRPLARDRRHLELEEFRSAADGVAKAHGTVDGMLREGGLDLDECGRALQVATRQSCWPSDEEQLVWPPNKVQALAKSAKWPSAPDWYAASAKAFLEACAASGLAIRVSY